MSEHEESLLGICLVHTNIYWAATEILAASDFSRPAYASLWGAIGSVAGKGVEVDPILVADALGDLLEPLGGKLWLHSLVETRGMAANWKEYARSVREDAVGRQVRAAAHAVIESEERGLALLTELEEMLVRLERPARSGSSLQKAIQSLWVELSQDPVSCLEYPWKKVQRSTYGMSAGQLCILAGETSHGKTAAAMEVTRTLAGQGHRVLYISLEMSARQLAMRLLQSFGVSGDSMNRIQSVSAWEFEVMAQHVSEPAWSLVQIERISHVEDIVGLVRRYRPELVVLDHLHLVPVGPKLSRYEGITESTGKLKSMAVRLGLPFLVLAQLSRVGGEERSKLPRLSRLRDSGSIEQDADQVIFCWRKYDEEAGRLMREGAFVVAKSRMGTTGSVRFKFDGARQTFEIVEDSYNVLGMED